MRWNTCRFCESPMATNLVKYGTRHYAHPKCYLDAGKSLADLPTVELNELPYFLLKERGLLSEVERLIAARKEQAVRTIERIKNER